MAAVPAPTTEVRAHVPPEVVERARAKIGRYATTADVIRHALMLLAGVNPEDYPVRRPGRPRKVAA